MIKRCLTCKYKSKPWDFPKCAICRETATNEGVKCILWESKFNCETCEDRKCNDCEGGN